MLDDTQLLIRLLVALVLGALMGLEREAVGKEAGIRTAMLVSSGAAIFTMIGLMLPYLIALSPQNASDIISHNGGFLTIIGNIVIGIGFLGAGIIIKTGEHVRGLTTAAVVWTVAAIGILAGLGQFQFATVATIFIAGLLYLLRTLGLKQNSND